MTAPGHDDSHDSRRGEPGDGGQLGMLRRFVDSAPFAICMLDREMRYVALSPRFRQDLGLGDAPLAGISHYDMFPATPEFRRAIHRRCLEGATESSDADAIARPDGRIEWYRRTIQPWHREDGTIGGITIFAESLTPALAAEAEARRWIDAFENAAFGITITDLRTVTIATANPAFAAMLGKTVDEVRNATTADIYPAEEIPRILACREKADRDGHAVIDTVLLAKGGARLPVQLALTSVGHADGAIRYRIASVLDITERNRTEAALRQAQKMEAVGQLTGGIAHDFNNLLAIIIGNLDMAQAQLGARPELHQLVGDALDAALRGADLARRLLAFARLQPLQPERLQLNELIGRTVKLLDRILGEDVPITFTPAPDLWPTVVDASQVEAALLNLATNARDAMPRGGRLTIASANRHLDADYAARHAEVTPGDYAAIEVTDTGTGMPPEVAERIFEPFFTTKDLGKGTGLGLSMIFGFMKQSGGHVSVYSEPGIGTTFRLYFPRGEAAGEAAPAAGPEAPARIAGNELVLVVEDNEALRRVVLLQLASLGYRTLEAEGPEQALALLETTAVDLLFSDIVMPGGLDGIDLARRAMARWPGLRVVLTSGFPEARIADDFGPVGAQVRLINKPYRKADLGRLLREVLDA